MKANLHTHTTRCGHAEGEDADYVRAAYGQGFRVLGFSDHVPWPYESGYTHPTVRMAVSQLPGYVASVRALGAEWKGRIRVLCGFECEYFPAYMGWLRDMAEAQRLDYLILGNHYDTTDETGMYFGRTENAAQLARYVTLTVRGLETGLFSCLAHPDLFMRRWPGTFDADCRQAARDLCEACRALGVPMEYNMHMRYEHGETCGYPAAPMFEEAARSGVPVMIGLDAHRPRELSDPALWKAAEAELDALGVIRLDMPALRGFGGEH